MNKTSIAIIIYNLIIVLSVMYATQPLQPLLANEFHISIVKASLFTAVILFFLALSPIVYGYILENIDAKKMLINASIVLLITNLFLGFSNSFETFFLARILEGLCIPAILTSSMSILANMDKKNIHFNMSIYVASTVFGGLIGRVISGFIATQFGWRSVFFSLSFALLISIILLSKINLNISSKLTKAKFKDVKNILKDKRFILIYFTMFIVFFVFSGLLNLMPFRLKDLFSNIPETSIGLLYLGYGTGIIVSLFSKKISIFFAGKIRTILFSTILFIVITICFSSENLNIIFILMFFLCIAMFTIHSLFTGMANSLMQKQKGLTSGMYLTFYYIGGATGAILPSFIYIIYGWNVVISYVCIIFMFSIFFIVKI